jgi:hypothetical protein
VQSAKNMTGYSSTRQEYLSDLVSISVTPANPTLTIKEQGKRSKERDENEY